MISTGRRTAVTVAISAVAIVAVAGFEGFSRHTYTDVAGVRTIGYGHTGSDVKAGQSITREQAEKLLVKDLNGHWRQARRFVKVPISQNEADAYASFVYNVGVGSFKRSTLLKKLNAKDYDGACGELRRWVYAGGRKMPGLVKRREKEYLMCRGKA